MELVLGAANLGLAYGKAISRSLPERDSAFARLERAIGCGFAGVDTASAYGESERRIGDYLAISGVDIDRFQVSTKTVPDISTSSTDARTLVFNGVYRSMENLKSDRVSQILLHRWEHFHANDGEVWSALRQLKQDGVVGRLGVSVQSPEELELALQEDEIETIQLACNLLDWRYDTTGLAQKLERTGQRIEVRSVLLQGLLSLSPAVVFPTTPEMYSESDIREFLNWAAREFASGDVVALCIRYAISLPWADALVIGADSPEEIDHLCNIVGKGMFPEDIFARLQEQRPKVPASLLDPSKWN